MILMQNIVPYEFAILVISAVAGVVVLAGALEGWIYRGLKLYERCALGGTALAAIHHNLAVSVVSTVLIAAMLLYFKRTVNRAEV